MKHVLAKVTSVKALPKHRLALVFADGAEGIFDCSGELWGEVFEPLKDPKFFAKVYLDHGAPTWPNGADLDPAVLRQDTRPVAAVRKVSVRRSHPIKTVAEDPAVYQTKPGRRTSVRRS